MLRKVGLLVLVMLFIPLVLSGLSLASTEPADLTLPDLSYQAVMEFNGESTSSRIYINDGKIYVEIADQLILMDDFFVEEIRTLSIDYLHEFAEEYEVRELGTEIVLNQTTIHQQIVKKETGVVVQEGWTALELPLPLPLRSISYDEAGNLVSKTTIVELDFDPDFSQIDFNAALPFPLSGRNQNITRLTPAEFESLVPWYDVSQRPLPGFELTLIHCESYPFTAAFLNITLTYSDGAQNLRIRVFGERAKLVDIHGPSEFSLLTSASLEGVHLEPAIRSTRTNVMIGFMDPINRSDGNIFLRSVVLHPAR